MFVPVTQLRCLPGDAVRSSDYKHGAQCVIDEAVDEWRKFLHFWLSAELDSLNTTFDVAYLEHFSFHWFCSIYTFCH